MSIGIVTSWPLVRFRNERSCSVYTIVRSVGKELLEEIAKKRESRYVNIISRSTIRPLFLFIRRRLNIPPLRSRLVRSGRNEKHSSRVFLRTSVVSSPERRKNPARAYTHTHTRQYLTELSASKELKGEPYLSNFQSNRSFTRDVYIKGEREGRGQGQPILRPKGVSTPFDSFWQGRKWTIKQTPDTFIALSPQTRIYLPLFNSSSNRFTHTMLLVSIDQLFSLIPTSFANRWMDRVTRVDEERK